MKKITLLMIILFFMTSSSAIANTKCVTKGGHPASLYEELIEEAMDYMMQDDMAALQRLLETGQVFILEKGHTVYRQGVSWSGILEIRIPGSRAIIYTMIGAINCK